MKPTIFIVAMLALFMACRKEVTDTTTIVNGEYEGTFTRSKPLTNTVSSNVTISISDNKFTGTSSISHYPAICNGGIAFSTGKVNVTNAARLLLTLMEHLFLLENIRIPHRVIV